MEPGRESSLKLLLFNEANVLEALTGCVIYYLDALTKLTDRKTYYILPALQSCVSCHLPKSLQTLNKCKSKVIYTYFIKCHVLRKNQYTLWYVSYKRSHMCIAEFPFMLVSNEFFILSSGFIFDIIHTVEWQFDILSMID